MIRVYLAGPLPYQDELRRARYDFHQKRNLFLVTSRWLDLDLNEARSDNIRANLAAHNYTDIDQSNILVVYNPIGYNNVGTGGRHIEVGYAIGKKIPVVSFGQPITLMYLHPLITQLPLGYKWPEVMDVVEKIHTEYWHNP